MRNFQIWTMYVPGGDHSRYGQADDVCEAIKIADSITFENIKPKKGDVGSADYAIIEIRCIQDLNRQIIEPPAVIYSRKLSPTDN